MLRFLAHTVVNSMAKGCAYKL